MVSTPLAERTLLMRTQESSEGTSSSSIAHRKEGKPIVIGASHEIPSVALLDGKHVVSGDVTGKIRCWRIEDGGQVGTPMDAGGPVLNIAVSRDGKWIVSGTGSGLVRVWNAESHSKVTGFIAHRGWVSTVDVSPDGTKIATGSDDKTACVWSLSTSKLLFSRLKHIHWVLAAKFSPDGCLVATATRQSIRVYDSQNGSFLVEFKFPVQARSKSQSFAWASDSKQLFTLSHHGDILRVDVSTGTRLSQWRIHSNQDAGPITLVGDDTFIATFAGSSVSFWDTTSQEQIGTVVECTHEVVSMVVSSNHDLVACGDKRITLRTLYGILPSHYIDNVSVSA